MPLSQEKRPFVAHCLAKKSRRIVCFFLAPRLATPCQNKGSAGFLHVLSLQLAETLGLLVQQPKYASWWGCTICLNTALVWLSSSQQTLRTVSPSFIPRFSPKGRELPKQQKETQKQASFLRELVVRGRGQNSGQAGPLCNFSDLSDDTANLAGVSPNTDIDYRSTPLALNFGS
mgnify:CR=1 FL=1